MDDHTSTIFDAIHKETNEREHISQGLQKRIEDNERQRSQSEQDLQFTLQNEMSDLKGMIERERQERQLGDDEIIMALNRYTQQLQSSLSVISS
jgi:hypothetical protein